MIQCAIHQLSRVNVEDELELREVFFGEGEGKNYVVLCHPEDATYPVSSVFSDANNDGSAPADFKLLDCNHVLSSEKTVFDRFKLNQKQRPTIFVSGKVGPPKQVRTRLFFSMIWARRRIADHLFFPCRFLRSI